MDFAFFLLKLVSWELKISKLNQSIKQLSMHKCCLKNCKISIYIFTVFIGKLSDVIRLGTMLFFDLLLDSVSSSSNKFNPAIHISSCIKCNLRSMLQRLLRLGSVGYGICHSWSGMVGCKKKWPSWWRCGDSCHIILVIQLVSSGFQQDS